MKFINRFFQTVALCIASALGSTAPILAQNVGLYSPVPGSLIVFPALSTNLVISYTLTNGVANGVSTTNRYGLPGTSTNLALNISEYDYAGLTWYSLSGTNATLQIYKSFNNGANYETLPSFSYGNPANSIGAWTTNASLDVHGVTTIGFVIRNASNLDLTNTVININLKAPRVQTLQAGVSSGTSPGTPITVPNFP